MIKIKFFSLASVVFILIITFFVVNYVKAETIISASGTARALNSGKYLYFTGYNANVTLNNDTHQFSGYAWSTEVGWVAFGKTDNPDGPVIFNQITGALSGQARIISTGNNIDFNSSPRSSNVIVHSDGSFIGYAWGDELGWLDFSQTKAEGVRIGNLPQAGAIIKSNLFVISLSLSVIALILLIIIIRLSFLRKQESKRRFV